jgi:hypothetical protein
VRAEPGREPDAAASGASRVEDDPLGDVAVSDEAQPDGFVLCYPYPVDGFFNVGKRVAGPKAVGQACQSSGTGDESPPT